MTSFSREPGIGGEFYDYGIGAQALIPRLDIPVPRTSVDYDEIPEEDPIELYGEVLGAQADETLAVYGHLLPDLGEKALGAA